MEGYKVSKYTTMHKTDYGLILFNTCSCGLIKVNEEEAKGLNPINMEAVRFLAKKNSAYRKALIDHGFLVKNDVDEFALIKRSLYRSKYDTARASITVNTGLACNCRCSYCYDGQAHSASSVLSHEKARDIVAFIKTVFSPATKLSLSFLGGEPLLCFDHIKYIYSELKNVFGDVQFDITTNGVLIDKDIAKFLKTVQIESVQVSIDGLKHHHDKKRVDAKGDGTYDRIIANVKILQDADVPVNIRTHIDKEFMDNVNFQEWVDTIKASFDFAKPIYFYIAPITTPGKGTKIADEKFIKHMVSVYEVFMENRIPIIFDSIFSPTGSCFITSENSFSISCDGKIYKCWQDLSAINFNNRCFGNIYDGVDWVKLINYTNSIDVLEDTECRNCTYLPMCYGNCPEYVLSGESKCTPLKHYPEKLIALFMRYKGYPLELARK